jgi:hypothetical protein
VQDDINCLFWYDNNSLIVGQIEGYIDMIDCTAVKCELFYNANIPAIGDINDIDHTNSQAVLIVASLNGIYYL